MFLHGHTLQINYFHRRDLNVTSSEVTLPNDISPFAPISNSTPIPMKNKLNNEIEFGFSQPCTSAVIEHHLHVEQSSTTDEESIVFDYNKIT